MSVEYNKSKFFYQNDKAGFFFSFDLNRGLWKTLGYQWKNESEIDIVSCWVTKNIKEFTL